MERLTKQIQEITSRIAYEPSNLDYDDFCDRGCNKLGQMEDVEEDAGISFKRLRAALEDGIYARDSGKGTIEYIPGDRLVCDNRYLYPIEYYGNHVSLKDDVAFYFEDYGLKWALTKDELFIKERRISDGI